MFLGLLCLGFALLGATQTQTTSLLPKWIPAPSWLCVPLKENFQFEEFQGKWYVIGLAGNEIKKERLTGLPMYTTTYNLKENSSYSVTSILLREMCDYWMKTFVPTSRPGEFTMENIENPLVKSYHIRVTATNYTDFAMVFFKVVFGNRELFKVDLYGRTKELSSDVKDEFIRFSKKIGLTDEHIVFTTPIDYCIDGN